MTDIKLSSRSLGFFLVALLAAFMLFLGVRGFVDPLGAAHSFGVDLVSAGDAFYVHVKADRDLTLGLALVALLVYGRARALAWFIAAATIAPLLDCVLSLADARGHAAYALAVHGSAALYLVFTTWVLSRYATHQQRQAVAASGLEAA